MTRLSRDEYYVEITKLTALRSTCLRGNVGAIAVQDSRVVASGYNGSPPGADHCLEVGCDVPEDQPELGCQRTIHAEANLVAWAARSGVKLTGAHVWCTHSPCANCALLLVQAGVQFFTFLGPYRLGRTDILLQAGIVVYDFDRSKGLWGEETAASGVARQTP